MPQVTLYFILEDMKSSQNSWALVSWHRQNLFLFLQSTMPHSFGLVKHKCSQCHRSYTSLKSLRVHEPTHSGRNQYWCQVCGKGFQSTSNLRGHMAQHTGVAEFKCDICGRQYRYPQDYKRHLKQHSKESNSWNEKRFNVMMYLAEGF